MRLHRLPSMPLGELWLLFQGLENTNITFAIRGLDELKCVQAVVEGVSSSSGRRIDPGVMGGGIFMA